MSKFVCVKSAATALAFLMAGPAVAQDSECVARWEAATAAGIVYGVGIVSGEPTVEVDEGAWNSVPFDVKMNIADTLNCASFSAGKTYSSIVFISHLSHKRLGRWSLGRLVVE
jgi:hypothetical protein